MSLQPPDRLSTISKGKQKEESPQPTDLAEKLIAFRRRTAVATRPKDRSERVPSATATTMSTDKRPPVPPVSRSPKKLLASPAVITKPLLDAPADEFSRKLHISSSSSPSRITPTGPRQNQGSKLYNPDRDPIPTMRRTAEPEAMSDADSSYAPRYTRSPSVTRERQRDMPARQLFDFRKDDPMRFAAHVRPQEKTRVVPTPKSSGDYISAASSVSSELTLSSTTTSTTDASSAPSTIFDQSRHNARSEDSATNVFSNQLKRLYRNITSLESKIRDEDVELEDDGRFSNRILRNGKEQTQEEGAAEMQKWSKRIEDHKRLADYIHNMLEISRSPSVPASLHNIPMKYNIIMRLWLTGFNKILQSLQRACLGSPIAMEFLQEFIIYAYTFYTGLLEEEHLLDYRSNWLEALGDLARYRMAVAVMTASSNTDGLALTTANVSEVTAHSMDTEERGVATKAVSDVPAARIDDSPSPSVGIVAARALELPSEKEQWRRIAQDWYGRGLMRLPGEGKLHHHLGLLYREVEGEELRAIYHFVKSMVSVHSFLNSRENVLPVWSPDAQARRQAPDAKVPELFVLLHGMLFTNIQLDDFRPTFSRFMECLALEGAEERQWMMMAIINIGALFEYGKPNAVLKKTKIVNSSSAPIISRIAKKETLRNDDKMDVDDESKPRLNGSPVMAELDTTSDEPPLAFKLALKLTFTMLKFALLHHTQKFPQSSKSKLNPYLTMLLTFLATMLKNQNAKALLERSIPWDELAALFALVPQDNMRREYLSALNTEEERLLANDTNALPEDWCLRGLEWVSRNVYPHKFWKASEGSEMAEIEILGKPQPVEVTDGFIEDDNSKRARASKRRSEETRWIRIARSAIDIAGAVEGFTCVEGTLEWRVEGVLAEQVRHWKEEDRAEQELEEQRHMRSSWGDDAMDIDEEHVESLSDSSEEDDKNDSEEVKILKERRRYLRRLLQSKASSPPRHPRSSKKEKFTHKPLPIVAGYTVLVIDTNILLSSLSMFSSLVESKSWTVVVPLPVIMELDGLRSNSSPELSEAARAALDYITSHILTHSLSLKIQTSKGNYLSNLNVRIEDVDFTNDRSMDDLILKAAIWHDEHWSDRSALLQAEVSQSNMTPVKVVLITLDRNLRLKARSRQIPAASEKDLASLFAGKPLSINLRMTLET
ncbi:hypothetical protein FB446DRAFT_327400 [Lentinula raphanica]|nr:hypothetical protein FB446DRAFT_327400 [Lentinula raphanica]